MPTAAENLKTIRDNLITEVKTETTLWAANGPKPSYSLDGQSVSWDQWLENRTRQIESCDRMIQVLEGAWAVISRAKA